MRANELIRMPPAYLHKQLTNCCYCAFVQMNFKPYQKKKNPKKQMQRNNQKCCGKMRVEHFSRE